MRCRGLLLSAVGGILATAGVGCAHDLPGWKVASTEHFRVYTDQRPRVFESVLDQLEDVYAGLKHALFSESQIPTTEVFIFSPGEFHDLLGPVGGVALGGVGKGGILAIFEGWDPHFIDSTAAHELAHAFIGASFGRVPTWFNEGLATYCESIRVQDQAVLLGSRKTHVFDVAAAGMLIRSTELFRSPHAQFHAGWEASHYATAWGIVHFIWHGEGKRLRDRFSTFAATLASNAKAADSSEKVWQAVFPDLPLSELDDRLRGHLSKTLGVGKESLIGFAFERPERQPTKLAPADMAYVNQVRDQIRQYRRPDKL